MSFKFNKWIVDSCCSHYLTEDEDQFSTIRHHGREEVIVIGDDIIHLVKKKGTVVINSRCKTPIKLDSVYYVSDVKKNLFSVVNDVKFFQNDEMIKTNVIYIGARVDEMYAILISNKKAFSKKVHGEKGSLNHHGDIHGGFHDITVVNLE